MGIMIIDQTSCCEKYGNNDNRPDLFVVRSMGTMIIVQTSCCEVWEQYWTRLVCVRCLEIMIGQTSCCEKCENDENT